jgi:hypothetical protein
MIEMFEDSKVVIIARKLKNDDERMEKLTNYSQGRFGIH